MVRRLIRTKLAEISFSPRAWGWSAPPVTKFGSGLVLPTRVGMVRFPDIDAPQADGSPHARGDGPAVSEFLTGLRTFSPRAWGWSGHCLQDYRQRGVLPTRVGMVRSELL